MAKDEHGTPMKRKAYEKELKKLQIQLCHLQEWVKANKLRVIILFEGRDAAGKGGKATGQWVYMYIDQGAIDGIAVDGSGKAARGTGGALQPTQSGKVNSYGALLFGAAAVAALVLVIVNT